MSRPGELSGEPILSTRSPFNYIYKYSKNSSTCMCEACVYSVYSEGLVNCPLQG